MSLWPSVVFGVSTHLSLRDNSALTVFVALAARLAALRPGGPLLHAVDWARRVALSGLVLDVGAGAGGRADSSASGLGSWSVRECVTFLATGGWALQSGLGGSMWWVGEMYAAQVKP